MKRTLRELYGAGILFFYYFKWPMVLGYPALIAWAGYPRWWVADALWLYCLALIVKDFVRKFILKKSYCEEGSCGSQQSALPSRDDQAGPQAP